MCIRDRFVGASDTVKGIVAASVSVFVWVILWDPMESLLFNWVEPHLENNILRKLQRVDIVIRPKSSSNEAHSHGA